MTDLQKPVKVRAEVQWCFHNKPNEMSGKYQLDLCNLSDAAVKAIETLGLDVRKREDKPEKGFFITAKSAQPIRAYDTNGTDLSNVSIGNGSKAVVVLSSYEWKWKNKAGRSATIKKLVIEELHAYEAEGNEDDDDVL